MTRPRIDSAAASWTIEFADVT
ncbi:MAG: hypothetical protein QOE61_4559, partial [Micromonosporaceae bacterium]|nr:hypothetical protein [Micromonosporaceae bacterium]